MLCCVVLCCVVLCCVVLCCVVLCCVVLCCVVLCCVVSCCVVWYAVWRGEAWRGVAWRGVVWIARQVSSTSSADLPICENKLGLVLLHGGEDGRHLLRAHGQHRQIDAIELVETAPSSGLG